MVTSISYGILNTVFQIFEKFIIWICNFPKIFFWWELNLLRITVSHFRSNTLIPFSPDFDTSTSGGISFLVLVEFLNVQFGEIEKMMTRICFTCGNELSFKNIWMFKKETKLLKICGSCEIRREMLYAWGNTIFDIIFGTINCINDTVSIAVSRVHGTGYILLCDKMFVKETFHVNGYA